MTEDLCPNCEAPFSDLQMMGFGANQPSPRFQCGSIFVPVAKRLVVKTYACMKIAELRASIAKPAAMPEAAAKDAALGRAIQRASGELPEGFTICIDLENGAGSVELQDENCETLRSDESEPLSVQINDLIDEAIKSAAEEKDYE